MSKKDLLKWRLFRKLALSPSYPIAIQIFTLFVFLLLIAGGLAAPAVEHKLAGTLRHTNLAALIVWSLWWPLVIISATLFGRVWCQICPMELVNSFFSTIGLRKKVPKFMETGWVTALFYGIILLLIIRTLWAHRFPDRMAWFFLFLFAASLLTGLIFRKRSFCNYLCPVGRLLGLYATCSPFEWRVSNHEVCNNCKSKDCIAIRHSYRLTSRSCTSNLYPPAITDNRKCLLCTQCMKVCPHDNLSYSLRKPMADFFSGIRLSPVDLFILLFASGLAIWELAEEWLPARGVLEYLPVEVAGYLGVTGEAANGIHTFFIFIIMPLLLFLIPSLTGKLLTRKTLLESASYFALLMIPVIALGHSVKAIIRITSRLPYYPIAFNDPVGIESANMIAAGDLTINPNIINMLSPWVSWLAVAIFIFAIVSVWLIGSRSISMKSFGNRGRISHMAFALLYCGALLVITILARFG